MSTKSSRIPVQNRKPKPARVPNKWRNLPAYGHGITPTMKARPVIDSKPNEEIDGRYIDDFKTLMPVSLNAFMAEHAAMRLLGYNALSNDEWLVPCPNCQCKVVSYLHYAQRHRNGKPNFETSREFLFCAQCLYVGESILVFRPVEKTDRQLDTGDSDAA